MRIWYYQQIIDIDHTLHVTISLSICKLAFHPKRGYLQTTNKAARSDLSSRPLVSNAMVMEVDVEAVSVVRSIHEEAPCSLNTSPLDRKSWLKSDKFYLCFSHGNLLDNSSDFCGCFQKSWYPQIIHFTVIGFSIINHPFWGTPIFGNTLVVPTTKKTLYKSLHFFGC